MAKEFKFEGTAQSGQSVQGTVTASSKSKAKEKVANLAEKHNFRSQDLKQRRTFLYKVKHPSGEVVKGEQKAFSQGELEAALENMGMEVVKVQKKLLDFQRTPPKSDVIMFVRLAANLLREKMPFDEVLNLLVGDVSSKSLRQVIRDINADLKGGTEAKQAFMKHKDKLGTFTAYMLGIASQSGNMAEIYESTALFLERQDEFKKSVRKAMITPALTMVVLIAAFVWYVWWIFPQTAGLFEDLGMELPYFTARTLAFSHWLDANYLWLFSSFATVVIGAVVFLRTERGTYLMHKHMIRLPLVGSLLHKLNIEIYCRVFAILYSGAGDNINVIRVAAEACGNKYMEHRIKSITIPAMVAKGTGLIKAMRASDVFTSMAVSRFRSGAETGSVKESARQMADYYEKETKLKLESTVEGIQTGVAIFITIAIIILTVLSSEIALIQPSSTDMMGF